MRLVAIKSDYNRSISINNILYGMMTNRLFKTFVAKDISFELARIKV